MLLEFKKTNLKYDDILSYLSKIYLQNKDVYYNVMNTVKASNSVSLTFEECLNKCKKKL